MGVPWPVVLEIVSELILVCSLELLDIRAMRLWSASRSMAGVATRHTG